MWKEEEEEDDDDNDDDDDDERRFEEWDKGMVIKESEKVY